MDLQQFVPADWKLRVPGYLLANYDACVLGAAASYLFTLFWWTEASFVHMTSVTVLATCVIAATWYITARGLASSPTAASAVSSTSAAASAGPVASSTE